MSACASICCASASWRESELSSAPAAWSCFASAWASFCSDFTCSSSFCCCCASAFDCSAARYDIAAFSLLLPLAPFALPSLVDVRSRLFDASSVFCASCFCSAAVRVARAARLSPIARASSRCSVSDGTRSTSSLAHRRLPPRRVVRGRDRHVQHVARLQPAHRRIDRRRPRPLRRARRRQRLLDAGQRGAARHLAPAAHRHRRDAVIIARRGAQRELVSREHDRVVRGIDDRHVRRRIGDHIDIERRGDIGDGASLAARHPRPAAAARRVEAPGEVVPVGLEAHRVARAHERDGIEHRARASANDQRRPARHAHRLARRHRLGRSIEIRGIDRANRDVAHERPIGDAHDHRVRLRAPIAGDERDVGIERPERHRGRAVAHVERALAPRRAGRARVKGDRAPRSAPECATAASRRASPRAAGPRS